MLGSTDYIDRQMATSMTCRMVSEGGTETGDGHRACPTCSTSSRTDVRCAMCDPTRRATQEVHYQAPQLPWELPVTMMLLQCVAIDPPLRACRDTTCDAAC